MTGFVGSMDLYLVSDVCPAPACFFGLHCLRDTVPGRDRRLQSLICCAVVKDTEISKKMTSSLSSYVEAQILISEKEMVGSQPLQVLKSL